MMILFNSLEKFLYLNKDILFSINDLLDATNYLFQNYNISFYFCDFSKKEKLIKSTFNLNKLKITNHNYYTKLEFKKKTSYILYNVNVLYNLISVSYLKDEIVVSSRFQLDTLKRLPIIKYKSYIKQISKGKKYQEYYLTREFTPEVILYDGIIIPLPKKYKKYIKKLKLWVYDNLICYVKLYNKHPNADTNGIYCLSRLLFNDYGIDELINSIKVYNLDSCYEKENWVNLTR